MTESTSTTDAPDALELAALLCSKVCHDVVNPVGAIINGLEVMDDGADADMQAIALDLIRKSATQASSKLQFARMAFGAAHSAGATIDLSDARTVAAGYIDSAKVTFSWACPELAAMPKDQVKLILNLILIALGTIPRGGSLNVTTQSDTEVGRVTIVAQGKSARISDNTEDFVLGRAPWSAVTPQDIQPFYAGLLAKTIGMTVEMTMNDDETVTVEAVKAA